MQNVLYPQFNQFYSITSNEPIHFSNDNKREKTRKQFNLIKIPR